MQQKEQAHAITDFFLFHTIEGNRLLSGSILGTRPGRNFCFDLESHSFFDYGNPSHSGRGIKRLFELRGEQLPEVFRINYNRFKRGAEQRKALSRATKKGIYLRGPLDTIPPQMTPPNMLTFWDESGNRSFYPAEVYTYTDFHGRKVGYLLKAQGHKGETIVRPLSVWERLVGEEKTIFSYRQKAFIPFLYKADLLASAPEKAVIVVEGEAAVDAALQKTPKDFPALFTTWPFGPDSAFFYPEIYECLEGREVFLWPKNEESENRMLLLQKRYLSRAHVVDPQAFGLSEGAELAENPQFLKLLKNLLRQPDAYTF